MTLQSIDVEKIIIAIKVIVINNYNSYITKLNADKAQSDASDYGQIVILKTVDFTRRESLWLLVAPQVLVNADPYFNILIEDGGIEADEMDGQLLIISVKLRFELSADGFDDIRALRYQRALRDTFRLTRWVTPWELHIQHIAPEEYATLDDLRSWREVGIKIKTTIP